MNFEGRHETRIYHNRNCFEVVIIITIINIIDYVVYNNNISFTNRKQ